MSERTEEQIRIENELEDERLRKIRLSLIRKKLEESELSTKENFYNFIEYKNLDLSSNKDSILLSDVFIEYYFLVNVLSVYIELLDNDKKSDSPEIFATLLIFDKLFHTKKWPIKNIIDYFIREHQKQAEMNPGYAESFRKEISTFYDAVILKSHKEIN